MYIQSIKFSRFLIIVLIVIAQSLPGQKQSQKIENTIAGFFNGLSLVNKDTLKFYSTSDFQLLEDGLVWNMDTLIKKVTSKVNPGIKRINKFEFIKIVIEDANAWVSYKNTADFSLGEQKQTIRWLESAVLVREKGKWKIQMMHSTKLK